ncbi:MAG TPA: hypothetical protein VHN99_06965 [Deinococcales bacterium]|nr:hypothetical protein [Deinococcales bacterium]
MNKSLIAAVSAALALTSAASAWTPKLDALTAQAVVDDAYGRSVGDKVLTYQTVDLTVAKGAFAAGSSAVSQWSGDKTCLSSWLKAPVDFTNGSRPQAVTVYGQADFAYWAAVAAHDQFAYMTAADAVKAAQSSLPDGRLRAEFKLAGLKDQKLRDAYLVMMLGKDGKPVRPEKANFLDDWKQDAAGLWSGSMAYTFNAAGAGVDPQGTLSLLFRTEAKQDCAYKVDVDLSKFR